MSHSLWTTTSTKKIENQQQSRFTRNARRVRSLKAILMAHICTESWSRFTCVKTHPAKNVSNHTQFLGHPEFPVDPKLSENLRVAGRPI